MKGTSAASSGIVHQLLNKDNYERWKAVMQSCLQGQGLWDVVESASDQLENEASNKKVKDPKAFHVFQLSRGRLWGVVQSVSEVDPEASRKMKDAKALHIIQLSCEREILDEITHFKTAKEAWNHLRAQYGSKLKATPDKKQALFDYNLGEHKELFRQVERGDYIGNIGMAIYSTSRSGRTLLHVAAIAGHVDIVEKLVREGKSTLVNMKDERGYTALALVSHYTGNTEIAKCMVETKIRIRQELLIMQNKEGEIPVLLAAASGHKEMTTYLYSKTPLHEVFDGDDSRNRVLLLARCIAAEIFDVALKLLQRYEDLPSESLSTEKFTALLALAKMPSAFPSGSRFGLREQFIYQSLNVEKKFKEDYGHGIPDITNFVLSVTSVADEGPQKTSLAARCGSKLCCGSFLGGFCTLVFNILFLPLKLLGRLFVGIAYMLVQFFKFLNTSGIMKYFHKSIAEFDDSQLEKASAYEAMLHAAQHGIVEFINVMRMANPDLLLAIDSCNRGIFSHAVLNRKQNVFQLIHGLHGRKEIFKSRRDVFENNLLHLAAHLGPSSDRDSRSGAALQMQREYQWFKAVEEVVHPKCKEEKNDDDKKPHVLFTENHEELVKAGEKWAKDTAGSFTLVGTLITTVMFAAAFTVPGGNNQETGVPIFLHDTVFTTFLIADAISLFTSASSVLIFIGILTSRYAEKDFLTSLPLKLLFGLFFLFLSVCSMIVAFCAALAMILKGYHAYRWIVIGSTMTLGSIPLIVLVVSQLRLMHEIFQSTKSNAIAYIKKEQ
ncbi:PGG domain [Sesbania bispinosa]|nr:PGG domain [Sesbania bispinosa]